MYIVHHYLQTNYYELHIKNYILFVHDCNYFNVIYCFCLPLIKENNVFFIRMHAVNFAWHNRSGKKNFRL
jgi:hypothetical protein